ncbi:MAG: YHYH protein [Verrucomicrobia bacterium]|nr:YHYH protein [Verrucomicrobiota bacterium]
MHPKPGPNSSPLVCASIALVLAVFVVAQSKGPGDAKGQGFGGPKGGKNQAAPAGDGKSPAASVATITIDAGYRVIRANGLPDHLPGQFPNRGNPNLLAPQSYNFRVPLGPRENATFTRLRMHPFGVALNGVVFDPDAAEWWQMDPQSGWTYDPISGPQKLGIDRHNAHVQPTGAYHYHGMPTGLIERVTEGKQKVALAGWAADGFPIYGPWGHSDARDTNSPVKRLKSGYQLRPGTRTGGPGGRFDGTFVEDFQFVKGAGDLDEANGRAGVTPEFPKGTYHYVLTDDFPFIPRLYKGTPDASFFRGGPGGGPGGKKGPPGKAKGAPPLGK